jgi:choline-sulfatase
MNWTRRDFLRAGMAGAGASLAAGLLPQALLDRVFADGRARNVLFLAVDDLRPELGCYGHKQVQSPHIDRLAAEGMRFDRAYCQVPVCGASRASLLTGARPTRERFRTYKTRKDKDMPGAVSLPAHFQRNGYHTISNGKVYHAGDDDLQAWSEAPWKPSGDWLSWRAYVTEEAKAIARKRGNRGPAYEIADVADDAYPDGVTANKTIQDLRRLKKQGKPFFLASGFVKPHLPFNAPKKYWDLYRREEINLADNPLAPKDAPEASLHNWGELRSYTGIPKQGPLDDDLARTLIHGYYACVSYTDAQVGAVLAELDRLGMRDDTVVILWGDHGWNLGEHGLWCKHCNYRTSLRAPLIVRAPGIKGGQTSRALVEFVDIYPTLCDLSELDRPQHLEGASMGPLLEQPERPWKEAIFCRYKDGDTVKTDRYSYTEWTHNDGTVYARMLYDHQRDPAENRNLAEQPHMAEVVKRMRGLLQQGWKGVALNGKE